MNKDILFWIFAILQGYLIYYTFSTVSLTNGMLLEHISSQATDFDYFGVAKDSLGESLIFGGLLAISTIGIEYLIYSKVKKC